MNEGIKQSLIDIEIRILKVEILKKIKQSLIDIN